MTGSYFKESKELARICRYSYDGLIKFLKCEIRRDLKAMNENNNEFKMIYNPIEKRIIAKSPNLDECESVFVNYIYSTDNTYFYIYLINGKKSTLNHY